MIFVRDITLGLLLSVGAHLLLLLPGMNAQPAQAVFDPGISAVRISLAPSRASIEQAASPAPPPAVEAPVVVEQAAPVPVPEPVVDTAPEALPVETEIVSALEAQAVLPAASALPEVEAPPLDVAPAEVPEPTPVEDAPAEIETPPEPAEPAEQASVQSIEQDGSLEEKGVDSPAAVAGSLHPHYPRLSRKLGEEGVVSLEVSVRADGHSDGVRLLQGSGHKRLDRSAVKALQQATFVAAQKLGVNVDSVRVFDVTFKLEDSSQ